MKLCLWFILCCVCFAQWESVSILGQFKDYGCEYTASRLGYRIQTTLIQCQEACLIGGNLTEGTNVGCSAIEWHDTTGWCNLYIQLCNSSFQQDPESSQVRPWYRFYGDPYNYYPVTCILPHKSPGAVACMPNGSVCANHHPLTAVTASEYYKFTFNSTQSGSVTNCNEFPDPMFSNSSLNPCDVLGCAPVSNGNGYLAYRYVTASPTRAPTGTPTTGAPTPVPTLAPTLLPTTSTPPTLLPTIPPTPSYCVLDLTGSLFKLKNCSDDKVLLGGSSCELLCDSQSNRTDLFVTCSSNGKIAWPPTCVLQGTSIPAGTPISLSFGLNFTLGCHVNTSDPTDVSLITSAFANNIAQRLETDSSSINLTATTAKDGFVDFLLVLRDRPPNATATEDVNLILRLLADKDQRDQLFLLSFTRNGTECLAQGNLVRFRIDFDSLIRLLFDLLANLPNYGVALLLVGLIAVLIWIPWSSRKSPHPFALLLLLTSMFSLANRAYFLSFVADLSTRAAHLEPSLEPLSAIYVATAVFLGLSVGLNVLLSLVLFVGLRNSSKFQRRWFELHPGSAVCGLLVSAFNPGNILILRSRLCNSESLNAPFPVEHLRRLEWIGLVCVMVSDLPPLVLTALTMSIVQGSSRFNWNQTKLNLLLPIVFSSVVIVVAVAMRACKIRRYTTSMRQESQPSTSSSVMDLARME